MKKYIKEWIDSAWKTIGIIALLFVMGAAFGVGFSTVVKTGVYVI